jgi:hypothetical protein
MATSDYGGKFPHMSAYFYLFLGLHNLYCSPNIRMITYRRISRTRHVEQMGENKMYSEKFKRKPLRRLKYRNKDNTDVGL